MRIHSTGLGKTEMVLKPDNLVLKDGYLLFSCLSTEPVNWRIRILLERRDIGKLIVLVFKGAVFMWLLSLWKKPGPPPTDY
jgi:hypothetical protein